MHANRRRLMLLSLFATVGAPAVLSACGGSDSPTPSVDPLGQGPAPAAGGTTPAPTPAESPIPPATPSPTQSATAWTGFGRNGQHDARAAVAAQDLNRIVWSAAVDLAPPYADSNRLLGHYGAPIISSAGTVIFPVRLSSASDYRIEARSGANGDVVWTQATAWRPTPASWLPAMNPSLTPQGRVIIPLAGGRVLVRDSADATDSTSTVRCFYGDAAYAAAPSAFDATVFINTPLVSDRQGNVYFGFAVTGTNLAGLAGGLARLGADGSAAWVSAASATGSVAFTKAATNCAPALSVDESVLYAAVNQVPAPGARATGRLLALDARTLTTRAVAELIDPLSQAAAWVNDNATSSPSVGPDGDVYVGVLESSGVTHNFRGWLLHFDATLAQRKTPGSFGWDNTASIVPRAMLPQYRGASDYLLVMKNNSYEGVGTGDGQHLVSIVDPNASQADRFAPSVTVMQELISVLGPTPDDSVPGGVREWCFNSAVVDAQTQSVLMNNEDGHAYRWHLPSNTLSQRLSLNNGYLQAYTPTSVGPDGKVYTINHARLFALGA
jgi:hypothetical protein